MHAYCLACAMLINFGFNMQNFYAALHCEGFKVEQAKNRHIYL